jgi:potassium uptake TrkH family protein
MDIRRKLRKAKSHLLFLRELLLQQIPTKVTLLFRRLLFVFRKTTTVLIPLFATVSFTIVLYTVGFEDFYALHERTYRAQQSILFTLAILFIIRLVAFAPMLSRWRSRIFNIVLVLLIFYLRGLSKDIPSLAPGSPELISQKAVLFFGVAMLFAIEIGNILRFIYTKQANPALLFVGSFGALIILGGFMLMLPNATTKGIHPLDAFFTSVSAVCVTGLTVVDTATTFTMTGKIIILMLIQAGGLGIMTFAGLIGFLVTGSVSIENQLALRDMVSSDRMSNVIGFISRVIIVTITFEAIGAFLIYGSLAEEMFASQGQKIFFSIFHSISAFCNAGFSTLSDNLYDTRIRFSYGLHWVIALLVILGGMGFPILFNIFTFLRVKSTNLVKRLLKDPDVENYTNVLQATAKLSLTTYFILVLAGFVTYFLFEFNSTLREHPTIFGKITTSFFGSITPRTAGFNSVDLGALSLPTVMIYLLLMWIGASPGSTGGGIKTTVAAVAFLNMKSIILGRQRTEAFRTEVSIASIKRAFTIILLSLIVLGIAVLLLSIYDGDKGLMRLAFETFSAFSTVGLTLGLTPTLSFLGKLTIMAVMFIGRVGALTLLFAVVTRAEERRYRYPSEDIMF